MPTTPQKQGLAITSLVLGIVSLVTCFAGILFGIPAAILGHLARSRARQRPEEFGGAGLALAGLITGYLGSVIAVGLLVGWVVTFKTALDSAKQRAQTINCVNNLKQIGLAFRIWAGDYGELYPFNVSTNKGGTLELCLPGADGFDQNGFLHFRVLSNELNTPKILVCPLDKPRQPAVNFAELQPANISYQVRSGKNVDGSNPLEVLVVCPACGNKLLADGSVQRGQAK